MRPVFQSLHAWNMQHLNQKSRKLGETTEPQSSLARWKGSTATHSRTTPRALFPNSFYLWGRGRGLLYKAQSGRSTTAHRVWVFYKEVVVAEVTDSGTGHQDQSQRPAAGTRCYGTGRYSGQLGTSKAKPPPGTGGTGRGRRYRQAPPAPK